METPASIYDQLWLEAKDVFQRGTPHLDLNLADKAKDLRRGVTLVFQPTELVKTGIAEFEGELSRKFENQYYYVPEEYHVSVLSVLSGTESWRQQMGRVDACQAVIARVLNGERSFRVRFQGATASTGAVIPGVSSGWWIGENKGEFKEKPH